MFASHTRRLSRTLIRVAGSAACMVSLHAASGQVTTVIKAQVWNGSAWVSQVQRQPSVEAGPVYVRYVASYTGTSAPFAFGGGNFQPMVLNTASGDLVKVAAVDHDSIIFPENPTPEFYGYTEDQHGRPNYVGFSNLSTSNAIAPHREVISGVNTIRIAQAPVTNAPRVGAGFNNANGAGGVPVVQYVAGPGRPSGAPPIRDGYVDIPLFGMRIFLSPDDTNRNLLDPTRDLSISATAFSSGGTFRWFNTSTEIAPTIPSISSQLEFQSAFIDIVPSPGVHVVIAALGVRAGTRRRR